MELIHTRCRPTFNHEFALAGLKARGLKLGVASNSVRNTVAAMMDRASLKEYLNVMLSNEDVGKAKPDPEIYVTAMERLGVEPSESLIVEDNDHGVRAARASGAHVMVVRGVQDVTLPAIERRITEAEAAAG